MSAARPENPQLLEAAADPAVKHSGGVNAGVPAVAVSIASTPSNSSLTPLQRWKKSLREFLL